MYLIIQLIIASLGSLGFALMFHLRRRLLIFPMIGGVLCWGIYLLFTHTMGTIFLPSLLSSMVCALYSEILARLIHVPATIIYLPAMVPLVPGGPLYYTMFALVQNNWEDAKLYGFQTIEITIAIAVGVGLITALFFMVHRLYARDARRDNVQRDNSQRENAQ